MGITRVEFDRLLRAVPEHDGLAWRVEAVERPARRLGLITMPVLEVTLEVVATEDRGGGPQAAVDRFVERFLLAFQRAGG